MSIANPFSITYGDLTVGGDSSTLQLFGPYVIDTSHSKLRLVFDVIIVGATFEELHDLASSVEAAFRKRDQSLQVDIDGTPWDYAHGTTVLNVAASCQKSGNRDTDRGFSRAYTCTVEGELPATDQDGLRDLSVHTDYTASRQKIVTMRGTYTAFDGDTATETYSAEFDTRAAAILVAIDGVASWELVDEEHSRDRLDHAAQFSRQYVQLLDEQSAGILDDDEIKDHRVTFSEAIQHHGDSTEGIHRMRRVHATYDCSVDIGETQDLATVATSKVIPHLISLFVENFNPRVYGIEEKSIGLDRTRNMVSVKAQFAYVTQQGTDILEVAESVTNRESRQIDYTPVHNGDELAAYADVGWSVKERIYSRTAMVLGEDEPKSRIGATASQKGGTLPALEGSTQAQQKSATAAPSGSGSAASAAAAVSSGWNTVQSSSQSTQQWIGDPVHGQFLVTIVSDVSVQRFHSSPGGS